MESLTRTLQPADIELENIYLDPNNPRFVGHDWTYVPDEEIDEDHHQANALGKLIDKYSIDKLRNNMEINGYLPIDRIVVREFKNKKYVVLEGNRRIAAAKTIKDYTGTGSKVDVDVAASLKVIPALLYTGEDKNAAWVIQGLRHISGINDWSSFNKAKLLVEQMDEEDLNLTEVGQRFGLSAFGAGQWVRGYNAFNFAKLNTDYSEEIDERIYPYFQELFGRSSIKLKDWLGWTEDKYSFSRIDRLNEYVGWFYPREIDNNGDPAEESSLGKWENRIIGKRDDMRQLSFLIETSPRHFRLFRDKEDLENAYAQARVEEMENRKISSEEAEKRTISIVEECVRAIKGAPISLIKEDEKRQNFFKKLKSLSEAIEWLKS